MMQINIFERAGVFAENKDIARSIRETELMPSLARNEPIILNFSHVNSATQSFIHALISDALRKYGNDVLGKITFHKCNDTIKQLVGIVVDYMQEGMTTK